MKVAKKHLFYTDNSAFSTDPARLDTCLLLLLLKAHDTIEVSLLKTGHLVFLGSEQDVPSIAISCDIFTCVSAYRYASADEDEFAGLNMAWAASMRTLQKISELVITLSAASSAAFTVSKPQILFHISGCSFTSRPQDDRLAAIYKDASSSCNRGANDGSVQDMRNLREELKAKMAVTLAELRNMQQLEDAVQQAEVYALVSALVEALTQLACIVLAHQVLDASVMTPFRVLVTGNNDLHT